MSNKDIIVLIGAPASGKGTQAQLLNDRLGYEHISTGDMFRIIMKEDTPIGEKVKYYMDRAMLVPDDVSIAVLEERISQIGDKAKIVLDGYPRTINQAKKLEEKVELSSIIHLDVSLDSIKNRIQNRRICFNCKKVYNMLMEDIEKCKNCNTKLSKRLDDKEHIVKSRYQEYKEITQPVVDYFKTQEKLTVVNGEGDITKVFDRIQESLGKNKNDTV